VVVAVVAAAERGGRGRITREAARAERAKEREIGQAKLFFMTAPLAVVRPSSSEPCNPLLGNQARLAAIEDPLRRER